MVKPRILSTWACVITFSACVTGTNLEREPHVVRGERDRSTMKGEGRHSLDLDLGGDEGRRAGPTR